MWMIGRIAWRIIKKVTFVLLVGWTPRPPPDIEKRLSALETAVNRHQSKLYREEKAAEVAAEPLVTVPQSDVVPYWGGPVHSDGTPVKHGDSPH